MTLITALVNGRPCVARVRLGLRSVGLMVRPKDIAVEVVPEEARAFLKRRDTAAHDDASDWSVREEAKG